MATHIINRKRRTRARDFFPFLLLQIISVSWQFSQAQTPSGSLRGEVQDTNGGRVAAATIVVEARGSGWKREVKSDDRGEFRVNDILPGPYHVVVRAEGFTEASSDVDVVVSFVRDLLVC